MLVWLMPSGTICSPLQKSTLHIPKLHGNELRTNCITVCSVHLFPKGLLWKTT
ncbi:hypothetical protein EVA_21591 [gut metagenome]|uniref:Uncharacterized protein n=1 Tax=gut metagenome TaxID=749906 RepID=J9F763_9ZZZZ